MGQRNIDATITEELNIWLIVSVFILFTVTMIIKFVPWKELLHFFEIHTQVFI